MDCESQRRGRSMLLRRFISVYGNNYSVEFVHAIDTKIQHDSDRVNEESPRL